jgi:hypothetical protein
MRSLGQRLTAASSLGKLEVLDARQVIGEARGKRIAPLSCITWDDFPTGVESEYSPGGTVTLARGFHGNAFAVDAGHL